MKWCVFLNGEWLERWLFNKEHTDLLEDRVGLPIPILDSSQLTVIHSQGLCSPSFIFMWGSESQEYLQGWGRYCIQIPWVSSPHWSIHKVISRNPDTKRIIKPSHKHRTVEVWNHRPSGVLVLEREGYQLTAPWVDAAMQFGEGMIFPSSSTIANTRNVCKIYS